MFLLQLSQPTFEVRYSLLYCISFPTIRTAGYFASISSVANWIFFKHNIKHAHRQLIMVAQNSFTFTYFLWGEFILE
jgi:hypothetical protein